MVQPDDTRKETEPHLWPAEIRGHEETYEEQKARVRKKREGWIVETKVYEGNTVHLRLRVFQYIKPHFVHGR